VCASAFTHLLKRVWIKVKFRRFAVITGPGLMLTCIGMVVAGPASAAVSPSNLNVDCRNGAASAYDQTFTGAIGETFTLTNTNGSFACVVSSYSGVVTASGLNGSDEFQSTPATFTIVSSGQFYVNYNAGRANRSTITVVVIPAASSTQDSSPTPLLQQFGKSLAATCDDAQPDGLNWGGASSGGWGESWSQWMSGNAGGFVCTRTLVYNNLLGHWVVD